MDMKYLNDLKKALEKKAQYGKDINLEKFEYEKQEIKNVLPNEIPKEFRESVKKVGIVVENANALYFQVNHTVLTKYLIEKLKEKGVIVLSTQEAIKKYEWAKKYYWNIIPPDLDKYTALTELEKGTGYFIYVPPNTKVEIPIQACLLISKNKNAQLVHNIIIADENSELNLITGCTTIAKEVMHVGVSEFYVKRNAKIVFAMIHNWNEESDVRPRSAAYVEENGEFINYYINLNPVNSLQLFPTIYLNKNSKGYATSIVYGFKNADIDVGAKIVFKDENSKGEIISRAIAKDFSSIKMRGELSSIAPKVKGHLECKGLILSDNASIYAFPNLNSKFKDVELTHEASIGKISEEELNYLMCKGFKEDEAISLLVRGFTDVGLEKLPANIKKQVEIVLEFMSKHAKL